MLDLKFIRSNLERIKEMMTTYRRHLDAQGLEYVIHGHIGNGHLHVNVLPRDTQEFSQAKNLYQIFAREAVRIGGSISAEHGIGKTKRDFLFIQYSHEAVEQNVQQALGAIDGLDIIQAKTTLIRVEEAVA